MNPFAGIWQYRQALWNFVMQRLKVRYKRSFFGFFWSFLNPLLMIATYLIAFKYIMGASEPNYSVKLFTTLLAWRFFQAGVMDSSASVSSKLALLKQVNFPRIILPTSAVIANFIDYLFSLLILVVVFAAVRLTVNWHFIPLVFCALVIQIIFTFGFGLILASYSVYYADIQFLMGNLFQMWLFLSPVLYGATRVADSDIPQVLKTIYFLNPPATWLMAYRSVIPNEAPTLAVPGYYIFLAISAGLSLVVLAFGLFAFHRYEPKFAKEV